MSAAAPSGSDRSDREPEELPGPPADTIAEARAAFVKGNVLARWSLFTDALLEFQRSGRLHPHPQTTFRMAECERGLGHDTRARKLLLEALRMQPALDAASRTEAVEILGRLERRLVTLRLRGAPPGARLQIDGRPVEADSAAAPVGSRRARLVSGTAEPGGGYPLEESDVEVLADAGHHRIVVAKEGYLDTVIERSFDPGTSPTISVELARPSVPYARYLGVGLLGAGGLGLAAALGATFVAVDKKRQSDALCVNDRCRGEGLTLYQEASDASTLVNYLLVISLPVSVVGASILSISETRGGPRKTASSPATMTHLSAGVLHDSTFISVTGSF